MTFHRHRLPLKTLCFRTVAWECYFVARGCQLFLLSDKLIWVRMRVGGCHILRNIQQRVTYFIRRTVYKNLVIIIPNSNSEPTTSPPSPSLVPFLSYNSVCMGLGCVLHYVHAVFFFRLLFKLCHSTRITLVSVILFQKWI